MAKSNITESIKKAHKKFARVKFLGWIVAGCAVLFAARLFYLQLVRGGYYRQLADENCISIVKQPAPRGYIYDRNYNELVVNEPSFNVSIVPFHFSRQQEKEAMIRDLAAILEMDPAEINEKLSQQREYLLQPVVIKRDLSKKELAALAEKRASVPGLTVSEEPKRSYPYNSLASHVLGYVGEVNAEQLKKKSYSAYRRGDVIGQTGIEAYYDMTLRGQDGITYILTDARGRQLKEIGRVQPKQGKNVVLTIDYRLQRFAEAKMEEYNYNGVIVASDPETGEILCAVSKPDYDLNYFSGKINLKQWKKLIRDKGKPLTNRLTQGLYSPGSIFKIAVGCGALNENIIGLNDAFLCDGTYWINIWPYKCWRRSGHGWVSFWRGITGSCDIYFYKVGLKMTVEMLHKYAVMFGLGEKTGVDLPGEKRGLVPSREWKKRIEHSPWFPGNTVMMSIGQGYIMATPLQILGIINVMANGGGAYVPHFFKASTDIDRKIQDQYSKKKLFEINVKPEVINIMRNALRGVVGTPEGTGKKSAIKGIKVAGKTGTVENPHGENHAMYAGFAPFNDPKIAVYVLIEQGGSGGDKAAPIAGKVMEFYLRELDKR